MNLPLFIGLRYTGAQRKARSLSFLSTVSIAGLSVGIALLLLVLSVMNGFDRELKTQILGLVPQAAIYHRNKVEDWQDLKQQVEAFPGVEAASPFVQLNGLVSHRQNAVAVLLYGFDPQAEQNVSLVNQIISKDALAQISNNENVILLGKGVADELGLVQGDRVMVVVPDVHGASRSPRIEYLTLAEVLETKTELDSSLALTSLARAAKLAGHPGAVSGVRLKLEDLFQAPWLMHKLTNQLGWGYYSRNWTRTHGNIYQAIQVSKRLVGLLMSLIVAIAAFNVVSTLVLVVVDKQGDIAILRTLGFSSRQVMLTFMVQGLSIGVLGCLFGLGLGGFLSWVAQDFVAWIEGVFSIQFLRSDSYPLTYLPTEVRLGDVVTIVLTALSLSFLATIYPAWKAAKIQPAEALRYE